MINCYLEQTELPVMTIFSFHCFPNGFHRTVSVWLHGPEWDCHKVVHILQFHNSWNIPIINFFDLREKKKASHKISTNIFVLSECMKWHSVFGFCSLDRWQFSHDRMSAISTHHLHVAFVLIFFYIFICFCFRLFMCRSIWRLLLFAQDNKNHHKTANTTFWQVMDVWRGVNRNRNTQKKNQQLYTTNKLTLQNA